MNKGCTAILPALAMLLFSTSQAQAGDRDALPLAPAALQLSTISGQQHAHKTQLLPGTALHLAQLRPESSQIMDDMRLRSIVSASPLLPVTPESACEDDEDCSAAPSADLFLVQLFGLVDDVALAMQQAQWSETVGPLQLTACLVKQRRAPVEDHATLHLMPSFARGYSVLAWMSL